MGIEGQDIHRTTLEAHVATHQQEIEDLDAALKGLGGRTAPPAQGVKKSKQHALDDAPVKEPPSAKVLSARRKFLKRRLAAHAKLIELARQPEIPAVLAGLAADLELAREAAADPAAFAQRRGIRLPEGAQVDVEVGAASLHIRVVSHDEDAPFSLVWTPAGFQPPPEVSSAAMD